MPKSFKQSPQIEFLKDQSAKTQLVILDETFSRLVEEQTKIVMLANVSKDYIFEVKDLINNTAASKTRMLRKNIVNISAYDVQEEDSIKDIGSKTSRIYEKLIEEAATILWNGPVGVFEDALFENGTKNIAKSIGNSKALTIAGGGDTISAIEKFISMEEIDYVSTGGGAFLEFLEGKKLPGIEIIKKL